MEAAMHSMSEPLKIEVTMAGAMGMSYLHLRL